MAQYEHLPIYRQAMQLAVHLEQVVRKFSRYNKYTLGSELREQAHGIVGNIIKANNEQGRLEALVELRDSIERLKTTVRIAQEVKAFQTFAAFSTAVEALVSLGRQSEGWIKNVRGKQHNA